MNGIDPDFQMADAIAMLVDIWKQLDETNVRKAWSRLDPSVSKI